ncbi:MAG: tetratricopeptide repeat protein [Pseudomonadota bacterium]
MKYLKKIAFVCMFAVAGVSGYLGAEWLVPKYFHPPANEEIQAGNIISYIGPKPTFVRKTLSGSYLAGQFAQNQKDWETASRYIHSIAKDESRTKEIENHAMILAMSAGEYQKAIDKAYKINEADTENVLATLFMSLDHFKQEDYSAAIQTLETINQNSIASFIIPILKLWAESADQKFSTAQLPSTNLYVYHAMLAGLISENKEEALKYAVKAFNISELDYRDAEKYADLFYTYDQKKAALDVYKQLEKQNLANDRVKEKIATLENEENITDFKYDIVTSPKDGAATVFLDMAEILSREFSDDSANVFAQMALALNPELEKAYLIISNIFARNKRYDDAIEILQNIDEDSKSYFDVQRILAELHVQQDKDDQAIEILKSLNQENDNENALIQIGDIHRYNENFEKAIQSYNKVLNQYEDVPERLWHVLYSRGMCYERLNKYEKSEIDLKQALEFRPNQPYLLNYLGYSWADQGIKLDQSLELIERAYRLKPDDGYIADSLGWVYYKLNEYDKAVEYLEKAVALLPYDPTINDHLGDAYWKVGRKNEARFQWSRALNNQEEEDLEILANLERKIKIGLKSDDQELAEIPLKSVPESERNALSNSDLSIQ